MSQWKAIYRRKSRQKRDEAFACTGCGAQYDPEEHEEGCHSKGPLNGLCTCEKVKSVIVSEAFRRGYEQIRWS